MSVCGKESFTTSDWGGGGGGGGGGDGGFTDSGEDGFCADEISLTAFSISLLNIGLNMLSD